MAQLRAILSPEDRTMAAPQLQTSPTTRRRLYLEPSTLNDAVPRSTGPGTPVWFALTICLGAALLFLVEPMVAKMILPSLGGSPSVWNTCIVFFQAVLLAGYAYAHFVSSRFRPRTQIVVHGLVLLTPLVVLPITVTGGWIPQGSANPVLWVFVLLLVSVGLPFFVVSASGPLLQKWFAGTGDPSAKDPYFLYAASNLGSMAALLGYPLLVEPSLRLSQQSLCWAFGYSLLAVCVTGCGALVWRGQGTYAIDEGAPGETSSLTVATRLYWIALSFVPSSLLLGVTTYLSTDIAAIPLLWVGPLALYLATFILVFARLPEGIHRVLAAVLPAAVLLLVFTMSSGVRPAMTGVIALHLGVFFVVCMVCHGGLARSRPAARHLTEFYLLMSLGGVLGGLFNALVAPLVFRSVSEYPLALEMACLVVPGTALAASRWRRWIGHTLVLLAGAAAIWLLGRMIGDLSLARVLGLFHGLFVRFATSSLDLTPLSRDLGLNLLWVINGAGVVLAVSGLGYVFRKRAERASRALDLALLIVLGLFATAMILAWRTNYLGLDLAALDRAGGWVAGRSQRVLTFGLPLLLCFTFRARPVRLTAGIAAVLLAGTFYEYLYSDVVHRERSFFGSLRVERSGASHRLYHGTTLHGQQNFGPGERGEPLTYYSRTGPIGNVFDSWSGVDAKPRIALVGLGTGTLAAYGEPGQSITYYEIDQVVEKIARNPAYFTYLTDATKRGVRLDVVLGDARLKLADAPDGQYGLLVVDAFSSDAIPLHLITREAIALYLSKLAVDGVLAFHISNRYVDLQPVLGNLAEDARLFGIARHDNGDDNDRTPSSWVLLTRNVENLRKLAEKHNDGWVVLRTRPEAGVWTDDFSNLLSVLKLR